MDRYDSDTANEEVSKQKYVRPNSDIFNSLLITPIYSYHTQSNLQENSRHKEVYGILRNKILKHL